MTRYIALIRGINVGGRTKMPMEDLRALCRELGWLRVETYIQSGNVIFEADREGAALEAELEEGIARTFHFSPPVIVRAAVAWKAYIYANPFPDASLTEPNRVLTGFCKRPLRPDAAEALQSRAAHGEQVAQAAGALWFHYGGGVGGSKLSPSLIDRIAGSPVTARNWRTVLKLEQLADG